MIIKKKLGNTIFGWNAAAFNGKGYWFTLGKNDSFARAANKAEAISLGKPNDNKNDTPKDVYKERSTDYKEAHAIKKIKLSDLISDKILDGGKISTSIKQSISEKLKAKSTRFKEKFDPLNIISALSGRNKFITSAASKIMGRSSEDAKYFFNKNKKNKSIDIPHSAEQDSSQESSISLIKISSSVEKIYSLLIKNFDKNKKLEELKQNKLLVEKRKDDLRFNQLLEAIENRGIDKKKDETIKKKPGGWLGYILGLLGTLYGLFKNKLVPFLREKIKNFILSLPEKIINFFKVAFKKVYKIIKPIILRTKKLVSDMWSSVKEIVGKLTDGIKNIAKKISDFIEPAITKIKAFASKVIDLLEKIPGVKTLTGAIRKLFPSTEKITERGGEKIAKKTIRTTIKKTAINLSSKALKASESMFDFLKGLSKIPVVGPAILLTQGYFDIKSSIEKYKKGEITGEEMTKIVVKEAGNLLGSIGGAALGQIAIPIPFIGGILGSIAGSYAGEWAAGKIFNYFKDHAPIPNSEIKLKHKVTSNLLEPGSNPKRNIDVSVQFPRSSKPIKPIQSVAPKSIPSSGGTTSISSKSIPSQTNKLSPINIPSIPTITQKTNDLSTTKTSVNSSKPTIITKNNTHILPHQEEEPTATTGSAVRDEHIHKVLNNNFRATYSMI